MIELVRAAAELQDFCEGRRWHFCFIGGLVVQMWAELRTTKDIDMTLLTGFGGEWEFIAALLGAYEARIPNAAAFAKQNRVLLFKTREGLGIDIALGALDFEERAVARSRKVETMPSFSTRLEGLILNATL